MYCIEKTIRHRTESYLKLCFTSLYLPTKTSFWNRLSDEYEISIFVLVCPFGRSSSIGFATRVENLRWRKPSSSAAVSSEASYLVTWPTGSVVFRRWFCAIWLGPRPVSSRLIRKVSSSSPSLDSWWEWPSTTVSPWCTSLVSIPNQNKNDLVVTFEWSYIIHLSEGKLSN